MKPEWISSAIKIKQWKILPLKADALFQHALSSVYQASIWTTREVSHQKRLSQSSWDWSWNECTRSWTWSNELVLIVIRM